jgi:hypothetical protein
MTPLSGWENFYVIVGSSAGALIGLQFVVITLIADMPFARDEAQASSAFSTPSVVHFGVVLLLAAIISAPWEELTTFAVLLGSMGLCGVVYTLVVARRMRVQKAYKPVLEDWLFHALFPFASYTLLAVSACLTNSNPRYALFATGAAALLLLFIGIHNAWDTVTHLVFLRKQRLRRDERHR